MNKKLIYIVLAVGLAAFYFWQNRSMDFSTDEKTGIQFYRGTLKEAMVIAKKENKLIFLDVYAAWCGPCKKLKTATFTDPNLAEYYNSNFVNVLIDGEKNDGPEVMTTYNLNSFPSLLFLSPSGEVIEKTLGFHSAGSLLELAKTLPAQTE